MRQRCERVMRMLEFARRSMLSSALRVGILIVLGLSSPPGFAFGPHAAAAVQDSGVFDEAWRVIRDNFYKRDLSAIGWDRIREQLRSDYDRAKSPEERAAVINRMLDRLGASHTRLY